MYRIQSSICNHEAKDARVLARPDLASLHTNSDTVQEVPECLARKYSIEVMLVSKTRLLYLEKGYLVQSTSSARASSSTAKSRAVSFDPEFPVP